MTSSVALSCCLSTVSGSDLSASVEEDMQGGGLGSRTGHRPDLAPDFSKAFTPELQRMKL